MKQAHDFYLNQPEPNRSCLQALRSMILAHDREVTETTKYGMPCFCFQGKAFCYLWSDKITGEPYMLMVEGRHLDHPRLERGDRARMKILRVNPKKDLPVRVINVILKSALDLYRYGKL